MQPDWSAANRPIPGSTRCEGCLVSPQLDAETVLLELPGQGCWQARNSPARRIPSHGTHLFGTTYAIDLVPVDRRGSSGPVTWRTLLASEDPTTFSGFGRPVVAPIAGTVMLVHDGEPDHVARRSPVASLGYALSQAGRVRQGWAAVAGNSVVIGAGPHGPYVLIAHLKRGSVCVAVGDRIGVGDRVGACGNSGNSTQPHVHLQVTESLDWPTARGIPLAFQRYRSVATGTVVSRGVPAEGANIESVRG